MIDTNTEIFGIPLTRYFWQKMQPPSTYNHDGYFAKFSTIVCFSFAKKNRNNDFDRPFFMPF